MKKKIVSLLLTAAVAFQCVFGSGKAKAADNGLVLGIKGDKDHDHTSALSEIAAPQIRHMLGNKKTTEVYTESVSMTTARSYVRNHPIFVSRSHGRYNADGTGIQLDDEEKRWLMSTDLTGELTYTILAMYIGCTTAYRGNASNAKNLISQSVKKSCTTAVGFKTSINCGGANDWTRYCMVRLGQGKTVSQACKKASELNADLHYILQARGKLGTNSYSIAGDPTYYFGSK